MTPLGSPVLFVDSNSLLYSSTRCLSWKAVTPLTFTISCSFFLGPFWVSIACEAVVVVSSPFLVFFGPLVAGCPCILGLRAFPSFLSSSFSRSCSFSLFSWIVGSRNGGLITFSEVVRVLVHVVPVVPLVPSIPMFMVPVVTPFMLVPMDPVVPLAPSDHSGNGGLITFLEVVPVFLFTSPLIFLTNPTPLCHLIMCPCTCVYSSPNPPVFWSAQRSSKSPVVSLGPAILASTLSMSSSLIFTSLLKFAFFAPLSFAPASVGLDFVLPCYPPVVWLAQRSRKSPFVIVDPSIFASDLLMPSSLTLTALLQVALFPPLSFAPASVGLDCVLPCFVSCVAMGIVVCFVFFVVLSPIAWAGPSVGRS